MKLSALPIPLIALGICVTLLGLGLDAALHRADPDLSTEEGIFAPTNPGHNLLWAGIFLTVCGVAVGIFTWQSAQPLARRLAPIAALLGLAAVSIALAATEEGNSESTFLHEDGEEHGEAEHAQVLSAQSADPVEEPASETNSQNRHDAGHEVALTLADYELLQEQLEAAREGTEKYKDIAVALAEGYRQTTSFAVSCPGRACM
jgi:hypothetical protein